MTELSPERRVLIAFLLSFVVLGVWHFYIRAQYGDAPPPESAPATAPPSASAPVAAPPPAATPAQASRRQALPDSAPAMQAKQGAREETITVETAAARIVFSTRGAVVKSWTLKDYKDDRGEPLEMAHPSGPALAFDLPDPAVAQRLNQALYVANAAPGQVRAPAEVVFEWSDPEGSGLLARKRLRFEDGYTVEVETEVIALKTGSALPHALTWAAGPPGAKPPAGFVSNLFVRAPQGMQRQFAQQAGEAVGWIWKTPSPFPYSGEASYAGVEDRYFAALFLPAKAELTVGARQRNWQPVREETPVPVGELAVRVSEGEPLRVYVGPKSVEVLEGLEPPAAFASGARPVLADDLVDFGWFWWVGKPLFLWMKWTYQHWIPNYGWVIVLLTVIINMALFPLKWKSMLSAYQMQKISPQMKAIQEKYAKYKFNDPRKQPMQAEMMALYQAHGVNPLGGCLPLVLQLPFWIAFYRMLDVAIELRQAGWLWVDDLAAPDMWLVLLMVGTFWLTTKMTPMTTPDPAQQRMMQFMPLLFGFMFILYPIASGLVLYILMANVVGVAQQFWMNRHQAALAAAEKEERRAKKKGPGGGA